MKLYLFDDGVARAWEPFALTRPAGELLFGILLLRERIERTIGASTAAYLATPGLEGFEEEGAPPGVGPDALPVTEARLVLSTRYVPSTSGRGGSLPPLAGRVEQASGATRLTVGGTAVGWILPAGAPFPPPSALVDPEGWSGPEVESIEVPGHVLGTTWELLDSQETRLLEDLRHLSSGGSGFDAHPLPTLPGIQRIGDHPVTAGEGVRLDPAVVLDTREGPIHLEPGVQVRPFTHLRGPAFIGRDSILLGGTLEGLACGPVCRLRGEVSASIVLGYANKAHDGFLGRSILGRWVNLGAYTTNSDLKNNYGSIRVSTATGTVDTGLIKLGVFLGDHVKTGIGTLLNGGTSIGAGSNVFGNRAPPRRVPPFRWGTGDHLEPYRLDAFLDTAETVLGRRGVVMTSGHRRFLSQAWREGSDGSSPTSRAPPGDRP